MDYLAKMNLKGDLKFKLKPIEGESLIENETPKEKKVNLLKDPEYY